MSTIANHLNFISRRLYSSKMTSFTLYGARGSTCTNRVRLTLAEGGLTDYELVYLNLQKGEQKSPEHLALQPWGKVPVLAFADGFTVYESRAICKYIAAKYSFPLIPSTSDREATALFDQAQCEEMTYFGEPATKLSFEKHVKKFMGMPLNEAVVSDALRSLETFFDVSERQLQDRAYMAGKDFTLVDIYYIPLIQRLFGCGHGDLISNRKAVSAWWERCVNRPAIKALLAADKEAVATLAAAQK